MFVQQDLTDRQLKYFGASLGALVLAFAFLAHWKWGADRVAIVLAVIAVGLTIAYYVFPGTRRSIYKGFVWITRPIQLVMTALVLGVVYYGVLTPIGFFLRIGGVNLRKKQESESLWANRKDQNEPSGYFKTY